MNLRNICQNLIASFKNTGKYFEHVFLKKLYYSNMGIFRNATIQKWYDKTRLSTGKSFSALEKPILQQIEQVKNNFLKY